MIIMKTNKYIVLRFIFALLGIASIIASWVYEGEHNGFLPFGLLLISITAIINNLERKNREK